ncbi:MAG: aldo/keto reductase [Bryobacteraceae bacterium]
MDKTVSDLAAQVISQTTSASETGLPQRFLGRTGERISILGMGGWHVAAGNDRQESIRILHAAQDEGINFFDNAWDYHDGYAEEVMGEALAMDGRRYRVFLMTKVCERDYAGATKNLEDSLRRLRTDHLDLWQFHECVYDNDPEWVFEKGAIRAALEARQQGKIRFIGFTGHKDPWIHLKMLAKPQAWDAAQMPVNFLDAYYRSFQNDLIPECLRRNIGVIGMKGLGGGHPPEGRIPAHLGVPPAECYRYCLSQPVATQVAGISNMQQLRDDVAMARHFKAMTAEEMEALRTRFRDVAGDGRHELFKSSKDFDSAYHRNQHGFAASAG